MKKLISSSAVGALALLVSACGGERAEDTAEADAATAAGGDVAAADASGSGAGAGATGTASPDWPKGTRIVEEGGTTYRVGPDGARVAITNNEWRIVTEGGQRYRVNDAGTRVRLNEDGLDVDVPVDVDLGTNSKGNLDLDVSTDGTDAKIED